MLNEVSNHCRCFYKSTRTYLSAAVYIKENLFDRCVSQILSIQKFKEVWLSRHFWSGLQTVVVWTIHKGSVSSRLPAFILTKTSGTQAHYWQPSVIPLPLFLQWWNVIWLQAIQLRDICQCEWHQKVSHKKRYRGCVLLYLYLWIWNVTFWPVLATSKKKSES